MVVAPRHAQTNHLGGLIMLHKILLGLLCTGGAVFFAIGALGLALGIGPGFLSFAFVTIGGFSMVVFSGLLGE